MPYRDFIKRVIHFWQPPRHERLGPDQANAVRSATPMIVSGNGINATVIFCGLLGAAPYSFLLPWLVATLGLSLFAGTRWLRTRDSRHFTPDFKRLRRIALSSAVFAAPWGALAGIHLGGLPAKQELIVVTVTAGMAGGGAVFLAPMYPAALVYLVTVLGPVTVKAFILNSDGYAFFGALALSYFAFLWAVVCWTGRQHVERSETNAKLIEQKGILQTIVDHFPGGISYRDPAGRVILCNDRGRSIPDASAASAHAREMDDSSDSDLPISLNSDNAVRACEVGDAIFEVRKTAVRGDATLIVSVDVTDRHRSQQALVHLAKHDVLTNLPNRFSFIERLDKAINGSRRADKGFALLAIDLDRFKEVNDTFGHPSGDLLLREVASRLTTCVREGDVVARLGGDEFTILQSVTDPGRDSSALAMRIQKTLSQAIDLGQHTVSIDVSIGIAFTPQDAKSAEELSRKADIALLAAKAAGRNQFRYFEPEMDAHLGRRRAIEAGLRKAIERNELHLKYQPILDLRSDRISGFEALLRWDSAELGPVIPSEFIAIAEEAGLIIPIGRWVIAEACREAAGWTQDVKVAVNLSPVQFKDEELILTIASSLTKTGLHPGRLEIEVTETAMLSDEASVFSKLASIRRLGVRVALDDFGTGHSSIANLKCFPFDKIKIDRTFIVDLKRDDPFGTTFITMIASLGRHLELVTTAEGVETSEQLQIVTAAGCSEMQGFLLSRPINASAIPEFLEFRAKHSAAA